MIAERALASLPADRSAAGIVLFSEGDPWEHARANETYREQMTFLIQRVRAELIAAGVPAERIKRAYLWLEDPDIGEAVRHLAAIGAGHVVLVPVTFPAETIATMIDARYAAERSMAETGAEVSLIAPWGNDPAVVDAMSEAVEEALSRIP
jgi:protoheme ferro-lyase